MITYSMIIFTATVYFEQKHLLELGAPEMSCGFRYVHFRLVTSTVRICH